VSKAVVQLEQWLGVGLLLRSTRSVVPTEAGRVFYERARRAIEEADEAVMAARGSANSLSGKLRVSTSVCFGRLHVIPYLSAFLAQHPNLDLDLILDDRLVDLVQADHLGRPVEVTERVHRLGHRDGVGNLGRCGQLLSDNTDSTLRPDGRSARPRPSPVTSVNQGWPAEGAPDGMFAAELRRPSALQACDRLREADRGMGV
jgi:hypothetical protein